MAIEYKHIGWCNQGGHDKVWGVITLRQAEGYNRFDYVTFWGRRGKKLQTKIYKAASPWDVHSLFQKKLEKNKPEERYTEVDKTKLDQVYPEFENDLKETAFWSTFKI